MDNQCHTYVTPSFRNEPLCYTCDVLKSQFSSFSQLIIRFYIKKHLLKLLIELELEVEYKHCIRIKTKQVEITFLLRENIKDTIEIIINRFFIARDK